MKINFWNYIRLVWMGHILKWSLILGISISLFITLITLVMTGIESIDQAFFKAVWEIGAFWFKVGWSMAFLLSIIGAFKVLFNRSYQDTILLILDCETKEPYDPVIIKDIMPIWRKFLFFMVWIVAILALIFVGVFGIDYTHLGGVVPFVGVLIIGLMILKPTLLTTRNVRLKTKRKEL